MFKIQSILTFGDTETILQACISSSLHYFNIVLPARTKKPSRSPPNATAVGILATSPLFQLLYTVCFQTESLQIT